MTLLLAMLPYYLLGNLHCLGMCGPLAMMLGTHRFRYFYFAGRLCSFTLAGGIAGELGAVLNVFFNRFYISAASALLFGLAIALIGLVGLMGRSYPGQTWIARIMAKANGPLSLLMLRDQPLATFLFGFLAIALPCGQSLVVFSACALSGSLAIGLLNGFAFALLTSPSLFFAMHAHALLGNSKKYWISAGHFFAIAVGAIAICRGLAELDLLPHLGLSLPLAEAVHFVLY